MTFVTKDSILGADDLPREEVEVEEWGGSVYVRAMTSGEEKEIYKRSQKSDEMGAQIYIVTRTVLDESGERIFTDQDIAKLTKKNGHVIRRLAEKAMQLSGMTDDGDDAKNS